LEVIGVNAAAIPANVVNVEAQRDLAPIALVGDPVGITGLALHPDAPVACVADRGRPEPARKRLVDLRIEAGIELVPGFST